MSGPLLKASDIVAGYSTPVVGPVSLTINPGDIIGLSGPNGSGKSTLLKALANGVHIFSGRVQTRANLSLAWQQQQPVDVEGIPLSGRDFLNYAGTDLNRVPARLAAWLDKRLDSLSGGQYQLLSVWAVLGSSADLVFLDEPTNNLDPEGAEILADAFREGLGDRAVLLVSHKRGFLEQVCSTVVIV